MKADDDFNFIEALEDYKIIYKDDNPDAPMYSYKLESKAQLVTCV